MFWMRFEKPALLASTSFLLALLVSGVPCTEINHNTVSVKMTDEDRLLEELFKRRHYNPDSRPVERATDVVNVKMAVVPIQLAKIDDLNEVMEMLVWMEMTWSDFRLTWNESDYGGLSKVSVPCQKVWRPDIVLVNRAEKWTPWAGVNVIVSSSGACEWVPPMMAHSYCPIDIRWFPFDEQRCPFRFESWSYDTSGLNLTAKDIPVVDSYYKRNSEWELLEITYNDTTVHYPCCEVPTSHLVFTFHWRRLTLFYGFNLIMPCALLSALSAVTFIIPPESGERIGLGISTLLALSVNQLIVADKVPPTSDAIPLIGIYFASVMTVNAVSLMAMVCISNLYHRSTANLYHPLPDWVKTFVCIRLARLLRMPKPANNDKLVRRKAQITDHLKTKSNDVILFNDGKTVIATANDQLSLSNDVANEPSPDGESVNDGDWKYAALVIDRLCFYVCTLYLTTITVAFYVCAFSIRS